MILRLQTRGLEVIFVTAYVTRFLAYMLAALSYFEKYLSISQSNSVQLTCRLEI